MRKCNLGIHIESKHKYQYNPIPEMKRSPPIHSNLSQLQKWPPIGSNLSQPQIPAPSNFRLARNDFGGPAIFLADAIKFQNVIQEIKQWNQAEINYLLITISNLPNCS